jgi:MYXO-CTERM domain-containing protein
MRNSTLLGAGLATLVAGAASAEITGAYVINYMVTAADFDGSDTTVYVQDLYLSSDDENDVALNIFNYTASDTAATEYFQSFTGTGWQPTNLGAPFDTPILRLGDSFVTVGGFAQDTIAPEQAPGAGAGTGLDPNFGGNNAAGPGPSAGWYNGSPPSLNGQVGSVPEPSGDLIGLGVLIGRFATIGESDLVGGTLEVTWNQGLGTPGEQGGFTITPAPGALALLGLAGLAGRRRRG